MTDILIRNVEEATVERIDVAAARQGLSRNEYLRRVVTNLAAENRRPITRADMERSTETFADVLDEEFMDTAWQ